MRRSLGWLLACGLVLLAASPAGATGIAIGDPSLYVSDVPGTLWASQIVAFDPREPGDTWPGLDGSAALFEPDDIGFGPEPDTHLSVALGTAGYIELGFERSIVSDGLSLSVDSLLGAEIVIFEDGELDGASFYGRMRGIGRLLPLGSLAEVALLDPTAPGSGPNGGDTAIGIDLDSIFSSPVELTSILIVDDGITGDSQTFEVDAVANRSPGALVPEPGSLILLGIGLAGLATRKPWRRRRGFDVATRGR